MILYFSHSVISFHIAASAAQLARSAKLEVLVEILPETLLFSCTVNGVPLLTTFTITLALAQFD